MMNRLRKLVLLLMIVITGLGITGCKTEDTDIKRLKDLEFTVVEDADLPGELKEIIDEKKENPFKLSYSNKDYLYIVVGYGKQNSGGYSISVDDLYLTSNAIYIDTNLIGPSPDDMVTQGVTYPYVVVKLEFLDKSVVFE
ncbi:protease complex subunit PrcB family protein [Mobilitalea sibirica]|uniref:Protease complex subunit PrcB family protein n=2 Tax=Mobilitalea sibirica TaxID=1462919 RepID=A0A8J7HC89_9FIRM|nr:protease complex subunit PrcB family protein [Mobilitalea sibirica]